MRELHRPRTATENRESLEKASAAALESINKARSNVEKKFGLDPKASAGAQKPQLQLVPPCFEEAVANALQQGAEKYGAWNWRENQVAIMTYLGAIRRHLNAFLDGEDDAPDSGISHLGHIGASCAILLDAKKQGTLADDRPKKKDSACNEA